MSIKKRLDLIVKELGLSGRAFEKECGLANGSYSSIRDGVGADKLNKILIRYPRISADWLVSGKGEMMKTADEKNDPGVRSGSVFVETESNFNNKLNREEMKNIVFQMAGILAGHQQEISKLIAELELNGKRSDRLLEMIENGFVRDDEPAAAVIPTETLKFPTFNFRAD
jgi:hypothetical protein